MKKLFGLVILAGVPVACGTGLPSTPDLASTVVTSSDSATVSSQATGRSAPTCGNTLVDEPIEALKVSVVAMTRGQAVVRAEAVNEKLIPVDLCFAPVWTASERAVRFFPSTDPRVVTIQAPAGQYKVTATVPTGERGISASTLVTIR